MKCLYVALLAALAVSVVADDLITKSGAVYKKYSIEGASTTGLVIFHELGGATVPYVELPDDLRAKYRADEEKAAVALKAQAEQRKKLEEQRQRLEEQRQEDARRQAEEQTRKEERAREEAAKEEREKIAKRVVRGIDNYQLGGMLDEKDIVSKGSFYCVVKQHSKDQIPGSKLEISATKYRKFIDGIYFHADNYLGGYSSSDATPIFILAQQFLDRYPEAERSDEKLIGDFPIQGKYKHSYEGRTVTMDFSILDFKVTDDKRIAGRASISMRFGDDILREFDRIFWYMNQNDLFASKKIIESINEKHPAQKGKPIYEEAQKLISDKEAEISRIAREERETEGKRAREIELNPIKLKYDQMDKVTWYSTARDDCDVLGRRIKPYIGKFDDGVVVLRLKTSYDGSDWINYDKVKLLGDNRAELEVNIEYPDKKTDVGSGSFYEWADCNVTRYAAQMHKLAEANSIFVRFYGKYNSDFKMSSEQLKIFKEVMKKYAELSR